MPEQEKVLFVDDEPNVLRSLNRLLIDEEYTLYTAESGREGLEILEREPDIQVVVSDYRMPEMNGVDFLKQVYARWPKTVRIVLSGYADTGSIVAAINEGKIYRFIPKPWNDDELKVHLAKAFEVYFLQKKNEFLADELQKSNDELKIINENLEDLVRERTEEVLFQNKVLERAHYILDSLPVGVVGIDKDGMIVQSNLYANKILSTNGASLSGKTFKKVLPTALIEFVEQMPEPPPSNGSIELEGGAYLIKGAVLKSEEGQQGIILVLDMIERE